MRRRTLSLSAWLVVLFGFAVLAPRASLQQRGGSPTFAKGGAGDVTGDYEVPDPNWPQWAHPYPKPGYIWGSQGGVFAESPDRIYLANRGELKLPDKVPNNFPGNWGFFNQMAATQPIANMVNCIVVVDRNGKLIEAWNQWDKLFDWGRGPHQVYISPYDPQRFVWVVDDMRHVIYRFTHDGKQLVQTLGMLDEFGENDDLTRFRRPTMIDWLPDGTFFVADGYGNTRVVKFDKTGKALLKWGTRGTGPGQFNTPHGIAVGGSPPRVFVSDRGNRRIQVFDTDGKFLEEWPGIAPHSMLMSADEHVWAVDSLTDRIVKFDLSGHAEFSFGQFGTRPGYTWAMHQISADSDGNLYLSEVFGGRTQKYRPKPGADPTKLVWGRPLMPMAGARTN
jgi:hypothetical protein